MGKLGLLVLFVMLFGFLRPGFGQLRVGVVGLTHDHAYGILNHYKNKEVVILGIAETNRNVIARYQKIFALPDSLFYPDVTTMLQHIKPDAVLAYNPISEHLAVVEACAPMGISVMVEKPLAINMKQVARMKELVAKHHILLLTNYETTWYASNQKIMTMVNQQHEIGDVRKMIVHDGHQGPKEIGCSQEFVAWLTDPAKNGGGALMDFGCYGANLMTWLMNGQQPIAVTAVSHHIKPAVYPKVEDDATILLEYPGATGIIEASWNWPFSIKDFEVFGSKGYVHAIDGNRLEQKQQGVLVPVALQAPAYQDDITYLTAALKGMDSTHDLSSFENNIIVVRILEAAQRSIKEGKRIEIKK